MVLAEAQIESLQKIWIKPLNSFGLFYDLFMKLLKCQSGSCVAVKRDRNLSDFIKKVFICCENELIVTNYLNFWVNYRFKNCSLNVY